MNTARLILDHVYGHEAQFGGRVYLTQPLGQGRVADYSWAQVLDQSRRLAAHLRSRGLPKAQAEKLLSQAFYAEAFEGIADAALLDALHPYLPAILHREQEGLT